MRRSITRWTTALAAATIIALPVSGFAQTPPQTQPPTTAPQQPPTAAPQPEQPTAQPAGANGANQDAAKVHLTAARNALSQLTQLPAAAQLQGDARNQVSQLITNFNELITTKADWKNSYAKVESNLNALLGQATDESARVSGTAGAVGTSGTTAIDPAIRGKLVEFRTHLDQFEKVASEASEPAAPAAPPAAATTTPPPTEPTPDPASDEPTEVSAEELLNHVEAIEVILNAQAAAQSAAQTAAGGAVGTTATQSGSTRTTITSADVTLNQSQVEELRAHLAELRRLLEKK